uniref:ribosomal protein S16 n=1 Tax=Fibrocapsa japonica TaxID=94617 RepID=UPI002114DE00|nr:ribosomal protein S16 [Fibrocapsa japonica]UTE95240.1 ribosomal protein S16 [Fibrocapsa japonica]
MLKLRLKRIGRKKQPCYRIAVMENRSRRDGATKKEVGFYDPINSSKTKLNMKEIIKLMRNGAKATPTVCTLLYTIELFNELLEEINEELELIETITYSTIQEHNDLLNEIIEGG